MHKMSNKIARKTPDDLIYGRRTVLEALKSNMPIKCIYLSVGASDSSLIEDIQRKAKQRSVAIEKLDKKRFEQIAPNAGDHAIQGIVARIAPYEYSSVSDIVERAMALSKEFEGRALIVICDHIEDAGNLGAIIRSADGVGAAGVIIPNKRSAKVNSTTFKTSAGAISHTPVAQVANIASTVEELKNKGFWVVGASEKSDDVIWNTDLGGNVALVLGSEGEGISRLVLEKCDLTMSLPQVGDVASLNVAQAATVCMYEWLRQNMI